MKESRRIQTVWPADQREMDVKKLLGASVIFHMVIIGLITGAMFWESEPEVIEVPPIMELVSAPPPPKTPPKPVKEVEPDPEPEVEPEIEPEPQLELEPTHPEELKPKDPPKEKPKETSKETPKDPPKEEPQEPQEEWDTDFETEEPTPKVQKVIAPKVDNRLRMFENTVRAKIMRNFNPPKGLGLPYGTEFLIEITCLRQGGASVNVKVHTSSGAYSLDKYGLRAIKLAILPKIPPNYPEDKVKLHVKFVYKE